jgi:hypothetical protein
MKARAVFILLAIFLVISCAAAAEVTIAVPQRDYYARPGESALIPVTIASTYGHDVTGTLKQVMVPVNAGTGGSRDATMQSADLAAFTETRTVTIATGTSATAGDYLLTILFSYPDGGGRTVVLDGIRVHFITNPDKQTPQQEPVEGMDIPDPAAAPSSGGNTPEGKTGTPTPSVTSAISQEAQDSSALKEQLAKESNATRDIKKELEPYILADPLVVNRARSLDAAGFALNNTEISPRSDSNATFVLTYSAGSRTAVIRGVIEGKKVLFAEESASALVPLPDALAANATFREYSNRTAEYGFTLAHARINATPGRETVNLTFENSAGRIIRFNAQIDAGTVVAAGGESPEDPLAPFIPAVSLAAVLLIAGGIWHLAKTHRRNIPAPVPVVPEPEPPEPIRVIASRLLDEAERDAAKGSWPEAYRKTGRAVRVFVSHREGDCGEMTGTEVERLARSGTGYGPGIAIIVERCRIVGFAKGTPDAAEFRKMVRDIRAFLEEGPAGK